MSSLQELKNALREPITDATTLRHHLTSIAQEIQSSSTSSHQFEKNIAAVQVLLLENVVPAWSDVIDEDAEMKRLLEGCFAPESSSDGWLDDDSERRQPSTRKLATAYSGYHTLSTFLSNPKTSLHLFPLIISLLETLTTRCTLSNLWHHAFHSSSNSDDRGGKYIWEESVKMVVGLPMRVMNAYGRAREAGVRNVSVEAVDGLNGQVYYSKVMLDLKGLMLQVSQTATDQDITALSYTITRLLRAGLLVPPNPSSSNDPRPSFFTPIFPSLLRHLSPVSTPSPKGTSAKQPAERYPEGFWPRILLEMQQSDITSLTWSFLIHLTHRLPSQSTKISGASSILHAFLGPSVEPPIRGKGKQKENASPSGGRTSEVYDAFIDGLLTRGKGRETGDREAVEVRCRVVVEWVARGGDVAIKDLVERVLETWTDPKSIKYSLFAWQLCMSPSPPSPSLTNSQTSITDTTQLLLLAISKLPPYHPYFQRISFKPSFLASMQEYLSHSDGTIRRLGMLVAEILSERTIPDSEDASPSVSRKGKGKGKEKDDEVEELERMLQSLGDDGDDAAPKAAQVPSGKQRRRLDFGREIWDGFGQGKEECRRLRQLVHGEDDEKGQGVRGSDGAIEDWLLGWAEVDLPSGAEDASRREEQDRPRGRSPSPKKRPPPTAEPDSDDESLSGYSSSAHSSRSPSPTPSYLEEVAKDPMSNTNTREKVQRPVYIIQLIELLRAREEPDKLEVGLKWGESLVRRKRHFGKELEENSIFLCQVLCALSDPYDIEEFEERRQSMLVALTACVPKRVAPYLIEQYFIGEYSMIQRSAILTALSMAARETAGFSTLPRPNIPKRVDFPSKVLPPALHDRYLTDQDVRGAAHAGLLLQAGKENVMDLVLKKKGASDSSQAVSRQRQLRPGNSQASSARGLNAIAESADTPVIPFKDIAAEYFILPMVNRFWTYFQDELARESRAAQGRRGFAMGTGMILSPMALSHFISALTIMLHAAQHSPAFLAILAPEGLELAIALGTQMGLGLEDGPALDDAPPELESDVVGASLELALVCLSGSKELDGGRSLVREHITSVMAAGEWASGVFGKEQKGESTTTHKGGGREDRIRRTAASVVITVKDVVEAVRR